MQNNWNKPAIAWPSNLKNGFLDWNTSCEMWCKDSKVLHLPKKT